MTKCARAGCNNTDCQRHSVKFGYLCSQCFEELMQLKTPVNISRFISTEAKPKTFRQQQILHFYDALFPLAN